MKLDHPEDIIGLPLRGNCDGTTFAQEIIETAGGEEVCEKMKLPEPWGGAKVGTKQCSGGDGASLKYY